MWFCLVFISSRRFFTFCFGTQCPFSLDLLLVLTNTLFCAGAVAYLLLLAVGLLCVYAFCAVYVTAGASASELNSPSGFFFGVSAISLAINMLFISKMLFNGNASITSLLL
jgi:hypothetical protein